MNVAEVINFAETLVTAILKAAPAIEQGIEDATPFVEAIVTLVKNGGEPTDADWAALRARLDKGSAALEQAAKED